MRDMDFETVDMSLLERVNPVYNTAKMTLSGLALAGDRDAAAISEKLGVPVDDQEKHENDRIAALQALANAVFLEVRFNTGGAMAEKSGCPVIVDLPCGYTPRGLQIIRKDRIYIGLDLPATINEVGPVIMSLADDEKQSLIKYAAVDATNYDSLEAALEGTNGPICVTTEGLVMYFNDSEAAALCKNIRRLLKRFGGCWITSDPEMMLINTQIMRAVAGEYFQEVIDRSVKSFESKADIHVEVPALVILPWKNIEEETEKAVSFLAQNGLKAERMIVGDHMPEIKSLSALKPEDAEAVRSGMKKCAYWKITPDDNLNPVSEERSAADFKVRAVLTDKRLEICLTGRMDTLTAPQALELYEKLSKDASIEGVLVDCTQLEYISSAGLRVLLIMHKACKDGVTIKNANENIMNILSETGFDSIFLM